MRIVYLLCHLVFNLILSFIYLATMREKQGKETYVNKSAIVKRDTSNLVINTRLQNSFDSRWAQVKIEGKNIASRSNHVAVVFGSSIYIHGGYDVQKGLIGDFYEMNLAEDCQEYIWRKLNNICGGREIRLKGHSAVTYKQKLVLFGGQFQTDLSNNNAYVYSFNTKNWLCVTPNINIPKVDSHCALVIGSQMIVYGGYMSHKAEYLRDILAFNMEANVWEVFHRGGEKDPQGRSNFAMVEHKGNLLIFGGTNGSKTLNDMWMFDMATKIWTAIDNKSTPEPRRGHSMLQYEDYLFMFGGIQDVTKEKNDIYIYQFSKAEWNKIHTTTNSVYDCSPTLKRDSKKNKSPEVSPLRLSPHKTEKTQDPMKKIINQNRQRKFQERKRQLLKQFAQSATSRKKKREFSPTTEAMIKTLESIGNQQGHKELKQQIIYDDSHRFIIGKKPCARDGQTVSVYKGKMYIFGGDRHLMAFNDLYQFDLVKGIKSLELYKGH